VPRPPEPGESHRNEAAWRRQVNNIFETQIARFPFLVQLRAVWRQLEDEREHWSWLLPVLAVVFLVAYRRERKFVAAVIREVRR
jgi:hypothetical protein